MNNDNKPKLIYQKDYYGYVYIWRDRLRKKFYIGSRYGRLTGYIGSNKWLKSAYQKRPNDFQRRILFLLKEPNLRLLHEREQYWLNLIPPSQLSTSENVINGTARYYNMKRQASGGNGNANKGKSHIPWNKGLTKETHPQLSGGPRKYHD